MVVIWKQRYSPQRAYRLMCRFGKRHGKSGAPPLPDEVFLSLFGPEPVVDVVNNPEHRRWDQESRGDPRVPAWEAELTAVDRILTKQPNPWPLRFAFVFLQSVEFAGMLQLLKAQGMENPERTIVAAAASALLFFLAYRASKEVV
jgi:hypothetical protein